MLMSESSKSKVGSDGGDAGGEGESEMITTSSRPAIVKNAPEMRGAKSSEPVEQRTLMASFGKNADCKPKAVCCVAGEAA